MSNELTDELFVQMVVEEVARARAKFSGNTLCGLAMAEEAGELARALLTEPYRQVVREAVQVATMALRVAVEGDGSVKDWRAMRGLDALPGARGPLHLDGKGVASAVKAAEEHWGDLNEYPVETTELILRAYLQPQDHER